MILRLATDDIVFASSDPDTAVVRSSANNFTAEAGTVTIPQNATSVTVMVTTREATASGGGVVSLPDPASGAGYTISATATERQFNISLNNNNTSTRGAPVLSIGAVAESVRVESGAMASFTITAESLPDDARRVTVLVSEGGDFISSANEGMQLVDLSTTETTTPYNVPLVDSDPDTDDGDSVITVTLLDSPNFGTNVDRLYNYVLADKPGHQASVTATDDQLLSISTAYTTVLPASSLYFTIMADPAPTGSDTITVPVTATDGDSNVLSISPSSLVINSTGSVQGRVTTVAGNLSDLGDLTVTLGAVAGYSLSPATITVPFTTVGTTARVSIAGPASVNEGGTATFTLSADPAADVDTTVQVNVFDPTARGYVTFAQRYIYLPANATTATFDVVTNDVSSAGADGAIAATVQAGAGYTGVTTTALVDVYDEDGTAVEVSVAATPASVEAGTDATFTFTRTGDTTNALTFSYELIETGEVTTESEGNVDDAEFAAGESTEVITVTTAGTTFNSGDGITLRLRSAKEFASATYRVVDPVSAKVGVTEAAAVPEITIAGPGGVTQGYDFTFTVTSNIAITAPSGLAVAVKLDDFAFSADDIVFASSDPDTAVVRSSANNFTAEAGTVTIPQNATSVTVMVTTREATASGGGVVSLPDPASGAGYTISATATERQFNISLNNNNTSTRGAPVLSIGAVAESVRVESGAMASFTITAESLPDDARRVTVLVSEGGDFISSANEGMQLVDLSTTETTTPYNVPLVDSDPDTDDGDSVITVTLLDSPNFGTNVDRLYNYVLADKPGHQASVTATDDQLLSISTAYTTVLPASSLYFTIMAEPAPTGSDTITVPVTATDGDSNVLSISPSSLVINSTGSVQGRVTTVAGNLSDLGDLTVTLGAVAGYSLSPATITVPFTTVGTTARVSIAGPASVNEGGTATFTLSADPAADVDTTVQVNVFDPTARGYVTFAQRYIYLPANATTATFDVVTNDVSSAGADGAIAATVQAGAGYTGVTTTALVDVYDEDGTAVEVSVAATPASVEAGTDATFTFTRTGDTTNALTFSYELIETGEVTTESEGNVDDAEFAAGESTEVITVTTAGTTFNSGDGITLRLRSAKEFASATYRVVDPVSAKVGVTEAAAVPEITIAGPGGVTQGYDFTFTVTSNIAITAPSGLAVAVKLDDFAFSDG